MAAVPCLTASSNEDVERNDWRRRTGVVGRFRRRIDRRGKNFLSPRFARIACTVLFIHTFVSVWRGSRTLHARINSRDPANPSSILQYEPRDSARPCPPAILFSPSHTPDPSNWPRCRRRTANSVLYSVD